MGNPPARRLDQIGQPQWLIVGPTRRLQPGHQPAGRSDGVLHGEDAHDGIVQSVTRSKRQLVMREPPPPPPPRLRRCLVAALAARVAWREDGRDYTMRCEQHIYQRSRGPT